MERQSQLAWQVARDLASTYTADLDGFITDAESYLDDIRAGNVDISDDDLQRMVLRLPILMYRLTEGMMKASLESDQAKAILEADRAKALVGTSAKTGPERKAQAELVVADSVVVVDVVRSVQAVIKAKQEAAHSLFDAIRKVMSARSDDKQTFRREYNTK